MKKAFRLLFLTSMIIILGCISNKIHAQCAYKVVLLNNSTKVVDVPCDFPLKKVTNDVQADANAFDQALLAWSNDIPAVKGKILPPTTTGIATAFFEIPKSEFDQFDSMRKAALQAQPQLYKLIQ